MTYGNFPCLGLWEGEQVPLAPDSFAAMVTQVSSTSIHRDRQSIPAIATVPSSITPASKQLQRPRPAMAPPAPSQLENSLLLPQPLDSDAGYDYQAHITGAVLFDNNGLPQEYFTTSQNSLENWEQLIFQLLGLRWLLMSSLNFDSFGFARASSGGHTALLLRQRETYLALLTENLQGKIYDLEFRQWLPTFELAQLRSDGRFQSF